MKSAFYRRCKPYVLALCGFGWLYAGGLSAEPTLTRTQTLSEFGQARYASDITHFPYVNPDAPKGGEFRIGTLSTFDTLNSYIAKGEPPYASIGLLSESLMEASHDETDGYYGVLAEWVEYPEDKSWAVFKIHDEARYHDGKPVVAGDFVYALQAIRAHARVFVQAAYEDIERAEALDDKTIKFHFSTQNSMKPVVTAAGMSPLPEHYWQSRDISEPTLEPILGSGPYRLSKVEAGKTLVYQRVKDHWGQDLAANKGRYNFDTIRYDVYRDITVMFEAFKAGEFDFWQETSPKRWATEFDFAAIQSGKVKKVSELYEAPQGMNGFFFNVKRERFQDKRVREAIVQLYDFETTRRQLLHGFYQRANTYVPNSEYASSGLPTGDELALLTPFKDQLPPELFTTEFSLPKTDGSGRDRVNKRKALSLFKAAGYQLKDGQLLDPSGQQLPVEIITGNPDNERLEAPFVKRLRSVGIDASIRVVDAAQWRARSRDGSFDLLLAAYTFYPPPGNELRGYWHSSTADARSGNSAGIKNPVVDALIDYVLVQTEEEKMKVGMRALDRVMLWEHYTVPRFYRDEVWFAYWDKFGRPEQRGRYKVSASTRWWSAAAAAN